MSNQPLPKFHESSPFSNLNDGRNHGVMDHGDHGTVVAIPVSTTTNNSLTEETDNSIPITALVLGLASAVCFVLMIIYIVLKVHCFNQKPTSKKVSKETIITTPKSLETGTPATGFTNTAFTSSANDLRSTDDDDSCRRVLPSTFRCHSIDFNHQTAESTLPEPSVEARLTGARFLPGQ